MQKGGPAHLSVADMWRITRLTAPPATKTSFAWPPRRQWPVSRYPARYRFTAPLRSVPASYSKKRAAACLSGSEWPCKKPDTDNLVKSIKDGCNGVVWKDDCQVVQVYALKVYGGIPGVSVKVEAAQPLLAVRGEVS